MRRVVVTGIGAVTPLGNTFADSWESLLKGQSGITELEGNWRVAGLLKGFDAGLYLSQKEVKSLDSFVHYAVASAVMAVEDSALRRIPSGSAVIIGSGRGGMGAIERYYSSGRASAYMMSATTVGMAASFAAKKTGFRGYALGISNSCASGVNAIGEAFRLIRSGQADAALAGGADAPVCKLSLEGYGVSGALSKKNIMRPFDRQRDGFVLGEGACALVLEEYGRALKRGVRIYGEIAGYGQSVYPNETSPESGAQAGAMKAALRDAGLSPKKIDYLCAHATATRVGDASEAEAISAVFGRHNVLIGSIKAGTGHMIGASGALETGAALMSLHTGIVPPIINLSEPDFGLNFIRGESRKIGISSALVNSFGFGGVNAVLALRAV